jgi:hypothetical protein
MLGASLSLALASTAQAQIALGIRAGYNNSKISVSEGGVPASGFTRLSGFHGGVDLTIGLATNAGLQVGAVYSQKGVNVEGFDAKIALDYIDVPVAFVFSIPTEGPVTPRLFIGGVVSFEMSCKLKGAGESLDCGDEDIGARKSTYFSGLGGAGIAIAAGPGSLIVDAGFQLGLTNISDETDVTVKFNTIQASLGYQFPIGG